jgi:hypothetical protein
MPGFALHENIVWPEASGARCIAQNPRRFARPRQARQVIFLGERRKEERSHGGGARNSRERRSSERALSDRARTGVWKIAGFAERFGIFLRATRECAFSKGKLTRVIDGKSVVFVPFCFPSLSLVAWRGKSAVVPPGRNSASEMCVTAIMKVAHERGNLETASECQEQTAEVGGRKAEFGRRNGKLLRFTYCYAERNEIHLSKQVLLNNRSFWATQRK